jgi:hypothetical protein
MEAPMASSLEGQRHRSDTIALVPSDVPTVEIAWRDGPTSHRPAEHVPPDPSIRIVSGAASPEVPVAELKRYAGSRAAAKPSMGRRMIRAVARFCIAVLIGVGATLAWQSHGDQASEIIKAWLEPLGLRWAASEAKPPPEITLAAAPTAKAAAQDVALPQSRSGPQSPPASVGQVAAAAASLQQLDTIARNLAMVQKSIEQLSAKQEEMVRNIAALQAAEQELKSKLSPVAQSKVVVPLPPRKRMVADAPAQLAAPSSAEPSPFPRPTPVARPPISLDPNR